MSAALASTVVPGPYRPSPTRRSRPEMDALRTRLVGLVEAEAPMTVRQVFYQAVSHGLIAKSEGEYKQTIVRLLLELRRCGRIPYSWIADNTRWQRKPITYSSMSDALAYWQASYRRSLWAELDVYVEIWLEKEALAGVLYDVTEEYDVPLMVTRGYASESYLYTAAETIAKVAKPTYIYYFGDHDPSGLNIPQVVERRLREFVGSTVPIYFERIAVTRQQIVSLNLPTRPTKASDTRSRGFEGESVEVDAIPPARLRELARECILRHVDRGTLDRLEHVEQVERQSLAELQDYWR